MKQFTADTRALAPANGAPGPAPGPRRFSLPGLLREGGPRQQRALRRMARFLALVLLLTLVARGTAGATLARVTLVRPYTAEITEAISAGAVVTAARTHAPRLPEGLAVQEILVTPGQSVRRGDALLQLDAGALARARRLAEITLEGLELQLSRLEQGVPYDGSALAAAQTAAEWAAEDAATAQAAGQAGIDDAARRVQAAADAAEQAAAEYETVRASETASPEDKAAAKQQRDTAREAVREAEEALAAAQTAAAEGNRAAARAVETSRQGRDSAAAADAQARREAAGLKAQNTLDAKALRLDIEAQARLLEDYAAIGQDGRVASGVEGVVAYTSPDAALTGPEPLVQVSDAAGGFRATATLPAAQAQQIPPNAVAEPAAANAAGQAPGRAALVSVSEPDANGSVQAVFSLPGGEWKPGQSLRLDILLSRATYPVCVPLSAVRQDQRGDFVLVLHETSGVLGAENRVQRVPVRLLAHDNVAAAIEGSLAAGQAVIAASSKPLAEGDKARVDAV